MYSIFELPENFLHKKYTKEQTNLWDQKMYDAAFGPNDESALSEELTPAQKKKVDSWGGPVGSIHRLHDSVFGEGVERISIPYEGKLDPIDHTNSHNLTGGHLSAANIVLQGLKKHGYTTDDYATGLVSHESTPERKIKISKALSLTGAGDEEVHWKSPTEKGFDSKTTTRQRAYELDPTRMSIKKPKSIVITRNQYDVAGMSTDRGWNSCMNMVDGCNRRFLKRDIDYGTLTAYFVNHDDQGIARPVGRVNLKHFSNGTHDIFRPEGRSYGAVPKDARKAITAWSEKNYESQPGIYLKNAHLYNDDGNSMRFEKPDQIATGSVEKNHTMMAQNARTILNQEDDEKNGEWRDDEDKKEYALNTVEHIGNEIQKTNPISHAHQVIHALIDHADSHDGERDDRARFQTRSTYGLDGDDVVHQWAKNELEPRNHYKSLKDSIYQGAVHMSPDEAMAHHKKIDGIMEHTSNPEHHPELGEVHGLLLHNIFKHGSQEQKDHVLKDVMSADNGDKRSYYSHVMENHTVPFDNMHPALHTTNPRILHSMILNDGDDVGHFPHGEHRHSDVLHHMGTHADAKMAEDVMNDQIMGEDDLKDFVKGLNNNSHGEKIQHALTSQMLLTGGHAPFQSETLDTTPVRTHYIKKMMDHSKFGERVIHIVSPHATRPHFGYTPEISDDAQVRKYGAIAEHSRFKSVVGRLRTREDTKDHPAIGGSANNNLLESVISLKQFLKSK